MHCVDLVARKFCICAIAGKHINFITTHNHDRKIYACIQARKPKSCQTNLCVHTRDSLLIF